MSLKAGKQKATQARKEKAKEVARQVSEMSTDVIGELVAFDVNDTFEYPFVKKCLSEAGLDENMVKEFLPKTAFSRAARKLSDERVIDPLPDRGTGEIDFQFTRKFLNQDASGEDSWDHLLETKLHLHKDTGKIRCDIPELKKKAEEQLDLCMLQRTSSDIHLIVKKLYEDQADLIPFGKNGTYIVLKDQMNFNDKVHDFLEKLTGSRSAMLRLPIASGFRSGDECVATSIRDYLMDELEKMKNNINEFTVNTKSATLERYAEKIKDSRNRVLGFVEYLKDSVEEVNHKIDELDNMTIMTIERIAEEKKNAPEREEGNRVQIFGHSVTSIIRWCGADRWTYQQVRALLEHYQIECAKSTITSQIAAVQSPTQWRGKPPELTEDQARELRKIVGIKAKKV